MKALLYLLLPEYQDPGNTYATHPFLATTNLPEDSLLAAYLTKLTVIVSYLKDENVTIQYDVKNLAAFLYPINLMPDVYPNKRRYQLELVEKRMRSWRTHSVQKTTGNFEFLGQPTDDNTLSEIAKLQYNNRLTHCVYAVINHKALNHVNSVRERICVKCYDNSKSFVVLKADVVTILNWLKEKEVIKRVYLPNSDKHGTAGKGGSQASNVSPLLCQNWEAKKMMKKAFRCGKHLYYYDANRQKFIRFMSGNNNTYHPYHIISKQDETKYIKPIVKDVLRYHLGNFETDY